MKSGIVPRPVEAEHLTAAGQLAETMSEAEARRLARELLEMREVSHDDKPGAYN